MSKPRSSVDLLREFAEFKSDGLRGVIRMQRLQEEAKLRLRIVEEEARRRDRRKDGRYE